MKPLPFFALLLTSLSAPSLWAQLPAPEDVLATTHKNFENSVVKIRETDRANRVRDNAQYLRNLDAMEKRYQQSGELEPLLAVRNERTRFKEVGRVEGPVEPSKAPDLDRMMNSAIARFASTEFQTSQSIVSLVAQYDHTLDQLQSRYTQANQIENALKIKDERAAIAALDYVIAAQEIVEARQQDRESKMQERATQVEANTVAKTPPGQVPNTFKGSDKNRIGDRYDEFIETLTNEELEALSVYDPDRQFSMD